MATKIVFRKYPKSKDIIALFPAEQWGTSGKLVTSYMHIGQHCSADYKGTIKSTVPATHDEYLPLLDELSSMGYNCQPIQCYKTDPHETANTTCN